MIFCTKEEGYPLKTNTDGKCFFSPVITDGLVTRRLARLYDTSQYRALLTERDVNHTLGSGRSKRTTTADLCDINGAVQSVDLIA